MSPKISIIIITHNKCAYLSGVLNTIGLVEFPLDDFEVIVVDDGSSDGTEVFLRNYRPIYPFHAVTQANAGRATARNACARLARGQLLMILDDDCLLHPDSLNALWHAYENDPEALLISSVHHIGIQHVPQVLGDFSDNAIVDWAELKMLAPVDEEYALAGLVREMLQKGIERFAVPWLAAPGTAVSLPAAKFAGLDGYDEAFVNYGMEDFDLAYRFGEAGGRFRWVPDSLLYHLDHGHERAVLFKESAISTRIFYEKFRDRAEIPLFVKFLCGSVSFRDFNNEVAAHKNFAPIEDLDVRFSPYGMIRYRDRQCESSRTVMKKSSEYTATQEYRLRFLMAKIHRDMQPDGADNTPVPRLDVPSMERVLVIAPHMDDEVIGCGGLIHAAAGAGAVVTVLYLTDGGSRNLPPEGYERMRRDRRLESERAADILGVERCIYFDVPERRLASAVLDPTPMARVLQEVSPDLVLVPSQFEHHPDHRAAYEWLCRGLAAGGARPAVYAYEVWGSCRPDRVLVLADAAWENKVAALSVYSSQIQTLDYVKLMRFTGDLRGSHAGAAGARGEAYRQLAAAGLEVAIAC